MTGCRRAKISLSLDHVQNRNRMRNAVVFTICENTEEIRSLLETLGVDVKAEYLQKRSIPHSQGYLGPGRLNEISKIISDQDIDLVVVNGELKPSQHHFLEMKFQKEFIDRTGVILGIFAIHAHTPEAIEQVKLAKLKYEQPFLREWIHKAKSGDRPGFLGGGAYATDVYYEHAKTQARRIEKRLKELSRQRETLRTKRREGGNALVSLAGYTNAGKSQLMSRLTESEVEIDERMFSTLSTTIRKVKGVEGTVLMSDTVGFIRNLPPDLINAFKSTLEEIFNADMVLLVLDVSDPLSEMNMKLKTSLEILVPRIDRRPVVIVGNKIDKITDAEITIAREAISNVAAAYPAVFVSALTGDGVPDLIPYIEATSQRTCGITARLPLTDSAYSFLSKTRKTATVSENIVDGKMVVTIRCRPDDVQKLVARINAIGGTDVSRLNGESEVEQQSTGKEGAPLEERTRA